MFLRAASLIAVLSFVCAVAAAPRGDDPVVFERAIELPNVSGRIDHLAYDVKRGRLYVAALGNDTVEVVEVGTAGKSTTSTGKALASLAGHHEPQGVVVVPALDRLVASDGEGKGCVLYDLEKLAVDSKSAAARVREVELGNDCDNVRLDPKSGLVWVGYGEGALASFDPKNGERGAKIELPGHPESFQLETNGARVFVNVPAAQAVVAADRATAKVLATWSLASGSKKFASNFPMALDETNHRLFVGCRAPARLLVLDTESGKVGGDAELSGDVDDIFLDAATQRVYASCGEGFLDVFAVDPTKPVTRAARIATAAGARTCLFAADLKRLFLAVPKRDGQRCEIRVYAVKE